jgi:phosphonoacetate hydrolase
LKAGLICRRGLLSSGGPRGAAARQVGLESSGDQRGLAQMPRLTTPNNLSIVTGVTPAVHGIPGNYCRIEDGAELVLNDPALVRVTTIHAVLRRVGVPVLMVAAKDKLRRLLGIGGVPSVSVEKAKGAGLSDYGVADVEELVGESAPGIYDPEASVYAMRIGLAVHRHAAGGLGLLYVSLTDRIQHAAAPGDPLADRFHAGVDRLLGEYRDEGFLIGITADHGMSAKHRTDGTPNVLYLADLLDAAGITGHSVVLPITDLYVRHHGSLGSFAWLYLPQGQREPARRLLAAVPGVEEVYDCCFTATSSMAVWGLTARPTGLSPVAVVGREGVSPRDDEAPRSFPAGPCPYGFRQPAVGYIPFLFLWHWRPLASQCRAAVQVILTGVEVSWLSAGSASR